VKILLVIIVLLNLENKPTFFHYGTCTITCIYKKVKRFNIEITGIICGGLCYMLPIEVPDLPIDHPRANLFNYSQLMYEMDKKFQKKCDELSLKSLYEIHKNNNIFL